MSDFMTTPKTFSAAFKKLRLQSGIDSLRKLCELLVGFDFVLEESTLSRWQSGSRIPQNRQIVLGLIKIFAIQGAISTTDEANKFLYLANLVPLSNEEKKSLALKNRKHLIFILPPKPEIIGTESTESSIRKEIEKNNGHLRAVLWGLPGTGKSSTAVSIGHQFQSFFQKGILWIRVLDRNIADIKKEIESILNANIHQQYEKSHTSESFLKSKDFLIIFDNVNKADTLEQIIKAFEYSSCLMTTSSEPQINNHFSVIKIEPFNKEFAIELFAKSAGRALKEEEIELVEKISNQVGNLPLPISIVANTIGNSISAQSLEITLKLLKQKQEGMSFFQNNFSQIISAFELLFEQLNKEEQLFLKLIAIRKLPIFRVPDVASDNFKESKAQWVTFTLSNKSLISATIEDQYKINPVLYRFLLVKFS